MLAREIARLTDEKGLTTPTVPGIVSAAVVGMHLGFKNDAISGRRWELGATMSEE